ncbi:hypothetical protein M430DRAFT_134644 [Amorphotheca resinae ATCC 22711]|uniref:FHA domain-containing protein n=1 Tax=Amorphotheca resinae ATCC 22711 TaxID=857342 RepID=A0A2T3BBY4_AMORE|nr:hypothetical protein M430DRAFT_134644 [Amorphotheca resinae ATCC 22711]PSS25822.1 hypothetical protein M430DRAFT_134644 [Amorphotheca resinae ATCC 22711]
MMDSSPSKMNIQPNLSPTSGVKRPAPTLLPAFEPFSSSPGLPRPSKRQARSSPSEREQAIQKYPTPIPTSTTGVLSSSPPQIHAQPGLHRAPSVSERAPLSAVPSITLPENGETILMGRSSNSSHYQLSANRLISRVHVKARYIAATVPLEPNKVEIICCGWNGVKLHCQGRTWELGKGDSFTSETEHAEIMLDVQDSRVLIAWPGRGRKGSISVQTDSSWDDENSPRGASAINAHGQVIHSSPIRRGQRLESPVSPTPAGPANNSNSLSHLFSDDEEPVVQIYEDENPSENSHDIAAGVSQISTQPASSFSADPIDSQSSELSDPEEVEDPDEENDPIVHSFGPFGANISSRMASFTTAASPEARRGRTRRDSTPSPAKRSSSESTNKADPGPVANHAVNQLAFSRLSSTPLSIIMNNLPAELKGASATQSENRGLTKDDLRKILNATPCIGEIHREGKDAAGKPLESEYYYIPDEDTDVQRRATVVDGLRKPSLRNCRKQHKQYYWKRPKTP